MERLNSLLETPPDWQQTNVTVNNTGLLAKVSRALMATVENAVEKLENLQVVMDKGSRGRDRSNDSISQALAYDQVRREAGGAIKPRKGESMKINGKDVHSSIMRSSGMLRLGMPLSSNDSTWARGSPVPVLFGNTLGI